MGKNKFAVTPPMGWNSWDCYGAAVTEKELIQNADYMEKNLKKYGWEYIICDIQWYEPTADSSHYHNFAELCMDEYGRVVPAPNRFPSAENGQGFSKIAEYVHAKGLKFGIHIMRGIPRQAVTENTKVKGTEYRARDIAHPFSICSWNSDMYGVDVTKPGAQEYYDSLIELYASWGVDFIKVDDICVKYAQPGNENTLEYGAGEIELLRNAIDKSGRAIVLSLSPGPAMVDKAEHLRKNANMWRITNDFWDRWEDIMEMFGRCDNWSPYVSEGCFPDCDMLPIGHISIRGCEHGVSERISRFTFEEIQTMMSLWCIFRSPLMLGCELTDLDEKTRSLITNEEVLALLKNSRNAHQVLREYNVIIWQADGLDGEKYIAVFNVVNWTDTFRIDFRKMDMDGTYMVRDLWAKTDMGVKERYMDVTLKSHEGRVYRLK
ncbi:MAG: glycoside hydrolase family 27 protein [Clostridia bacterium]|nr:glycoside hydrolase family 27 protein [Clostridia bacterium]NCC43050.1 glycoside hydrolase family 27 protein [Clostridia bacterium]